MPPPPQRGVPGASKAEMVAAIAPCGGAPCGSSPAAMGGVLQPAALHSRHEQTTAELDGSAGRAAGRSERVVITAGRRAGTACRGPCTLQPSPPRSKGEQNPTSLYHGSCHGVSGGSHIFVRTGWQTSRLHQIPEAGLLLEVRVDGFAVNYVFNEIMILSGLSLGSSDRTNQVFREGL